MLVKESLSSFLSVDTVNEESGAIGKRPRIKSSLMASASNSDGGSVYRRNPMHNKPTTAQSNVISKPILKKNNMGNQGDDIVSKWESVLGRPLKEIEKAALTMPQEEQKKLSITKQVYLKDAIENLKTEKRNNEVFKTIKEDPKGFRNQ